MSVCDFPGQFTCRDGGCVNIYKRCDIKKDCEDGSDEEQCKTLNVPTSYEVSNPPEVKNDDSKTNDIYTHVEVINVDKVSTIEMLIGLTIRLTFEWKDHNIEFENIRNHEHEKTMRIIPEKEKNLLWNPLPKLVHDNALIGDVKSVKFYQFSIKTDNRPLAMDPAFVRETQVYSGKENPLVIAQRMKLSYRCDFILVYFPFDETDCDFYLSIRTIKNDSIRLTNDENSVKYNGPKTLNEFKIVSFWSSTSQSETKTTFVYSMKFKRLYDHYLLTIFFQSLILWILSYITMFIDEKDFSNRFMGAVTALLVLAALLASLGDLLPKTAYFNFIDVWFNWFIGNILVIILIHVVIDYLNKKEDDVDSSVDQKVQKSKEFCNGSPFFTKSSVSSLKERKMEHGIRLNRIFKIILPLMNLAFLFVYFTVNIIYQKN